MFNHVLSIAAFGIVAFVLAFVHPALHAGRGAVQQQKAVHGSVAAAGAAAADAPSHLAASK